MSKVLFTGGSGTLGTAIQKLRPDWLYPKHENLNIMMFHNVLEFCKIVGIDTIVHAAAIISAPACEDDSMKAMSINILGTMNLVAVANDLGIRLVYISTDYVYEDGGCTGRYEDHALYPLTKYSISKLGGECACRMYDKSLIVRTSFGADVFPYDNAYIDQFTSREPVSVFAPKLVKAVESNEIGILNIGGKRQTVYDYACENIPADRKVNPISRTTNKFPVPYDTSLDTSKYNRLFREKLSDEERV